MNIKKDSAGTVSHEHILSKGFWVYDYMRGNDQGQMEWEIPQYTNGKYFIQNGYWTWNILDAHEKEIMRIWWNSNEEFDKTFEELDVK